MAWFFSDPDTPNTLLQGFFVLKRTMGYYFVQIFLPSILCICCAIASFWVKLQIAPARVTLAIATFLTLTQQQASVNGVLPKVSYVKVHSKTNIIVLNANFRLLLSSLG